MTETIDTKLAALRVILQEMDGVLVAFSGGLDSSLLAAVAHEELGERALAVTARSAIYPAFEQDDAARVAASIGIRHELLDSAQLEDPELVANPPERCYICKRGLLMLLQDLARQRGLAEVVDGTNVDDLSDHRPGRRALAELGVRSPLLEAGFGKQDLRALSRRMGLPTADRSPMACLATRIPFGTPLTVERLHAVDVVEQGLRDRGFRQVRVRHHGELARIEVGEDEIARLLDPALRREVTELAHAEGGFRHVTMDLAGYRMGSLSGGTET